MAVSAADSVVGLASGVEKRLIRPGGSRRYVDFRVWVEPGSAAGARAPLALALVIDRSGSMTGWKLEMAKQAARSVVARLSERDIVSVVSFDHEVEVLQPAAPANAPVKERLGQLLRQLAARGSTALHPGWLTGCHAIAGEGVPGTVARCLLLTDGLANAGLTDSEQIATEAAGIREHARVSTSTFGIGDDYDEFLLGPMAVGGGGQFHHLRAPAEIVTTFAGELGELFAVAAQDVRLEIDCLLDVELEVVSDYWVTRVVGGASIALGDLIGGDERHVVVRFRFPAGSAGSVRVPRARLVWTAAGTPHSTPWSDLSFRYADDAAVTAEPRDAEVMRWAARHQAEQALRAATRHSRRGDDVAARQVLSRARSRLAPRAADDAQLSETLAEIGALEQAVQSAPLAPAMAKEAFAGSQRRTRGQRDLRSS